MNYQPDWLKTRAAQAVFAALEGRAFAVGGCVRNALLGLPVSDIDLATSLFPQEVIRAAKGASLKVIPTGLEHGTVTVIAHDVPFEITTFRQDVATDGRRAVVAFAKTLKEDASRRDFTMNALYLDPQGRLQDPLGGLADLRAGRVRFIGDPDVRISEDALRILRFFRFYAQFGIGAADAQAIGAITSRVDDLARLSAERVTTEFCKLLSLSAPFSALRAMEQSGVLEAVVPGAELYLMPYLFEAEDYPDWITRLLALGGERAILRLSKQDERALRDAETALGQRMSLEERAYRFSAETALRVDLIEAAILHRKPPEHIIRRAEAAEKQRCPVRAADLCPPHVPGPELGKALRQLEEDWIASGFTLSRAELLDLKDP